MPCTYDNWDYESCDYGSDPTGHHSPSEHLKYNHASNRLGHTKASPTSAISSPTSDNGSQSASTPSHTSSPASTKSLQESELCSGHRHQRRGEHKRTQISNSQQSLSTFDSPNGRNHEPTTDRARHNGSVLESDSVLPAGITNKPLALTTSVSMSHGKNDKNFNNDGDRLIQQRRQSISGKETMHSQQDTISPISVNNLSADLPKGSVSPGTKRKEYIISTTHGYDVHDAKRRALDDDSRDFLPFSRHESSYHHSIYTTTPLAQASFPGFSKSWASSEVMMKSSPELRSYFSLHPSPRDVAMEHNRIRTMSSSGVMPAVSSSPIQSSTNSTSENLCSKSSSRMSSNAHDDVTPAPLRLSMSVDEPHGPSSSFLTRRHSASGPTATKLTAIKQETDEDHLSPGELSHHRLTASTSPPASPPYNLSSSLSPWSDCGGDYGFPNEGPVDTLGIPITGRTKCASDSSLYLPQTVNPSLSPEMPPSSQSPLLVDCRWKSCSQTFQSQKSLAQHVNNFHIRIERPDVDFQCHWQGCPRQGKGFNARYKMLIHIRTHTNEKPHKCAVCRKCFSRLENLKIHMRSHTGEKPYACTFPGCTKAYSNSSDRFKHVRTHQEEKPYKCKMPGCHKQYTDPSSLRKHVRTHNHCTNKYGSSPARQGSHQDDGVAMQTSAEVLKTESSMSPLAHRRDSVETQQEDFNKALEMDADRQRRRQWLGQNGQGHNGMTDIQHKIELYSSLEVTNGIQKFNQIENSIREDSHPPMFTHKSPSPSALPSPSESLIQSQTFSRNHHHHPSPPPSRHPFVSVPSIVIEEADDYCHHPATETGYENITGLSYRRSIMDSGSDELSLTRALKRRIDEGEEVKSTSWNVEDRGEDLRTNINSRVSTSSQEVTKSPSSDCRIAGLSPSSASTSSSSSSSLSSSSSPMPTPTSSSSTTSSPPRHWKKRKILDEQRQQEDEEEKRLKEELARADKMPSSLSPSIDKEAQSSRDASPTNTKHTGDDCSLQRISSLQQQERRQSLSSPLSSTFASGPSQFPVDPNQLSQSLTTPINLATPLSKMPRLSPQISADSPHQTTSPSTHNPLSPSRPLSLSPHIPHHPHLSLPPPHPLLSPSFLYSYPELISSKLGTLSPLSSLSSLSPSDSSALLFSTPPKMYRDIYFPPLNSLVENASLPSPTLDPLTIPHQPYPLRHPLVPTVPSPHYHNHLHPATSLLYPNSLSLSLAMGTLL